MSDNGTSMCRNNALSTAAISTKDGTQWCAQKRGQTGLGASTFDSDDKAMGRRSQQPTGATQNNAMSKVAVTQDINCSVCNGADTRCARIREGPFPSHR